MEKNQILMGGKNSKVQLFIVKDDVYKEILEILKEENGETKSRGS